jgi:hypothetical protein
MEIHNIKGALKRKAVHRSKENTLLGLEVLTIVAFLVVYLILI